MATTLSDISDLAVHPRFIRRVTAAVIKAAVVVAAEPYDGTNYKIMRRALATKVFEDTDTWGERFSWSVAANGPITVTSTDAEVDAATRALWDATAGAYQ
jgi:hypothetical protein